MTSYELLKKRSKLNNSVDQLSFFQNAVNGLTSTSATAFITHPMDVVKTKLMTQTDGYYKGVLDCIKKIVAEEGFFKLFVAVEYRIILAGVGGVIFFSVFETMKKIL